MCSLHNLEDVSKGPRVAPLLIYNTQKLAKLFKREQKCLFKLNWIYLLKEQDCTHVDHNHLETPTI